MERNMKRVYVMAGKGFTVDSVKSEVAQEGYKFAFNFTGETEALDCADEIWTFGDCRDRADYKRAVVLGKDIWVMG